MAERLITREDALTSELSVIARSLLLELTEKGDERSGIGAQLDLLTVLGARYVVAEVEAELARIARYREALIRLKQETIRSVG